MSDFYVSPRHKASEIVDASVEAKVEVFAAQIQGWLFDHASTMASDRNPDSQHSGFALLTLLLVYVEAIACFIRGESSDNRSQDFFGFGLREIFPDLPPETVDAFYRDFYRQVRCGQLHQGLTRGKVSITRGAESAIRAHLDSKHHLISVVIDPWLFLDYTKAHFEKYVSRLRDGNEPGLRKNFEQWFDSRAV